MLTFAIVIASVFNLAACQGLQSASLEEAHEAWLVMQHEKPGTVKAQTALLKYDHAVAQVVQCLRAREGTAAWGKEMHIAGMRGWRLTFDAPVPSDSTRTLALAEFAHCRPAAEVRLHGFDRVVAHDGIGVPVVLVQDDAVRAQRWFQPPQGECLSATAVLEFPADVPGHAAEARLRFYNPLAVSEIAVGGQVQPLAENLTAALQGTLTDARVEEKGAGQQAASASGERASRLFFLSRYDKGKVPVIFVHGMLAGSDVWKNCVNEMYADEGLRRRYQPVCFSYPSKLPIPASAARLRELLTQARSRFDARHENAGFGRMVLVGHSMGGLLARMQVIDSGEDFWRAFFDVSPERVEGEVDATTRHMLQQSFFFKRRSDIGTVVF
ncbi:MAG: alpha/beta fold hydrolase, partial [Prosthecobacter sp.]|uniref:esterase/lipase family protein n=1 Tax=Prosthecobacter sp. TaxID=1965333 RepID=UPI003BB1AF84